MDYKLAINEILERADKLGLSRVELCRAGGVSMSTLYRWQQDDANPRLRDLTATLKAMRDRLDARENELRAFLDGAQAEREISA